MKSNLFSFVPSSTGDTSVIVFHPYGRETRTYDAPHSRFSISPNSKTKRTPNQLTLFKEIVHWQRIYWMQNGRKACVPTKIVVYECGVCRVIYFSPWVFKLLAFVLNALPEAVRRKEAFKRVWGM